MTKLRLNESTIIIKGAGEMASGIAWTLHRAGLRRVLLLETAAPLAVRRRVSFCEAVDTGRQTVEGVTALRVTDLVGTKSAWQQNCLAVQVDPCWSIIVEMKPRVVIDAILAKRNLGTRRSEADLVIALGPGFCAGEDVDRVIETQRGHHLGRVIESGSAATNSGVPGAIGGYTSQRVLRAPTDGVVDTLARIGEQVSAGQTVATVAGKPVSTRIDGILRGLIRPGRQVTAGLKIGDIDPRGEVGYCDSISEKARAIGGAALLAIMNWHSSG